MTAGKKCLLDASALLALIKNEAGSDRVLAVLDDSCIHAVNLAEVARKLVQKGMTVAEVATLLSGLRLEVLDNFSEDQAYAAAAWAQQGLSLGDAVCLTAAQAHDLTVFTADRAWTSPANNRPRIVKIRD